jgi:hypothetical protein
MICGTGRIVWLTVAATLVLSVTNARAIAQNVQTNNVAANQRVVIHAVLPNPETGPEWVELVNESELMHRAFLPILTIVDGVATPIPEPAIVQPATSMGGWQLGNDDSAWYDFPLDLPPVPYGARVIVYFDGQGPDSNDYDFSDGVAVLHTSGELVQVFNDIEGRAILYAGAERSAEQVRSTLNWKVLTDE